MRAALARLREIVQKPPARPDRAAAVEPGVRVYAIGDIHGRADLLADLHAQIAADAGMKGSPFAEDRAADPKDLRKVIVYLGDYVDRGMDSKGVLDLLIERPLPGFENIYLKGNHEDFMLKFLDDPAGVGPFWFANGGDATLLSYGVGFGRMLGVQERYEHACRELKARLPESHLRFLQDLALMYQSQDYVFVHAGVRPGRPLEQQDPEDLLWIRGEFLNGPGQPGKVIVHGHSAERQPGIYGHRIGIDTGAFATNVLTCLVLEGTSRRFLSTAPR